LLQAWREVFDTAAIVQSGEVDGEKTFVLKVSAEGIPTHRLHVSVERGLVLKDVTAEIAPGIGEFPVTYLFSDFRDVDGVMLPFKVVTKTLQSGDVVSQYDRVTHLDELKDDAFQLTPKSE